MYTIVCAMSPEAFSLSHPSCGPLHSQARFSLAVCRQTKCEPNVFALPSMCVLNDDQR